MDKHLNADEKVLWNGKPVKAPFLFPALVIPFVIGLFFVIIGIFMYYVLSITPPPDVPPESLTLVVLLLVIPGLAIIVVPPLWQFMRYRNTEYLITDQRIITQTGAIGLDTRFVDLDKVQEVYVKVGVIDKLFGTGSVIAVTAGVVFVGMGGIPSFSALQEPYEVQKLIEEAMKKAQAMHKGGESLV